MLFLEGHYLKGVVIDIDGTIIDSLSHYLMLLNEVLAEIGQPPVTRDVMFKYLGDGINLKDILRKLIPGGDDVIFKKVAMSILERFKKIDLELPLFPGVREAFDFLKEKNMKIGVATGRNTRVNYEWERMRIKGLDHLVDTIVTVAEVERRKPFPDLIIECARRLDISPNDCLAIGDSIDDIVAAKRAGSVPVAVSTGIDDRDTLISESPKAVLGRFYDLIALFNGRIGKAET